MLIDMILDRTMPGLEKALDLTWRRNEAIVSNISNAETPRYRASDLDFGSELKRAFGETSSPTMKTDPKHMDIEASGVARLIPDLSGVTKPDGNNVDIDLQMGRLNYNAGKYSTAANLVRKKLQMISNAIRTVA